MPARTPPPATLAAAFDPRRNALTVTRLGLALVVLVTHALQLSTGSQPVLGPATELGGLAVDAFFVLSGYLVAGSLLRLGSVRRYVWHRALRILPGFWVCLLVTAILIAPLTAVLLGRPAAAVLTGEDSAPSYLVRNALLLIRQFEIGALAGTAGGGVANGALWTLVYEAVCYGLVVLLGIAGLLTRRRWAVLLLTAALQAVTVLQAAGIVVVQQELLLRLSLMFLLGVCALLFADRLRLHRTTGVLAAATLVAGIALLPDYRALGAPGLAVLLLWGVARGPIRWEPRADLSYGVYVYHWPLAVLLLAATDGRLPAAVVVLLVVALTGVAAAASWYLVEAPALRLKSAAWVTASPAAGWAAAAELVAPPHRFRGRRPHGQAK